MSWRKPPTAMTARPGGGGGGGRGEVVADVRAHTGSLSPGVDDDVPAGFWGVRVMVRVKGGPDRVSVVGRMSGEREHNVAGHMLPERQEAKWWEEGEGAEARAVRQDRRRRLP